MREQKILYAIQATGNGHLARAAEVLPHLSQYGEVDVLVSGTESDLHLPVKPAYALEGLSFSFGKDGGIDFRETFKKTLLPQIRLRALKELLSIPIEQYAWVLHDFEPITAWAAHHAHVPCAQLSHQAAFLSPEVPRAEPGSFLTELIFRYAAPSTMHIGLHYEEYSKYVTTPIIRRAIRDLVPTNEGHYVVYLPSYSDEAILPLLQKLPSYDWFVFNKHHKRSYTSKNVTVLPVSEREFLPLFASAAGIVTASGFQSTSEAIFLGKKLLSIPQRGQYEQACNARALELLGVPTLPQFSESRILLIEDWLRYSRPLKLTFPDHTEQVVQRICASMGTRERIRPSILRDRAA
jgi:uncharacterized protein (TIGR00661 family)